MLFYFEVLLRSKKLQCCTKAQNGTMSMEVNTVSEAVPVWLPVRYISNIGQYRCTVSDLTLFYIIIIIIIIIILLEPIPSMFFRT